MNGQMGQDFMYSCIVVFYVIAGATDGNNAGAGLRGN